MILQLVMVAAKQVGADNIFVAMILDFLQNRVELGNDSIDSPLHPESQVAFAKSSDCDRIVFARRSR